MAIRTRTRYPGATDSNIGTIPSLPQMLPWVTGRFYGCSSEVAATTTTNNTAVRARPIYVPLPIVVSTIGCEVSSAGGAGTTQRMVIYRHDSDSGMPKELVVDSGAVVADATGYKTATINTPLTAGWYWLGHVSNTVTSQATFRSYANAKGLPWIYDASANELTGNSYTLWINDTALGTFTAINGWPARWWTMNFTAINILNTTMPRVMLGV